VATPIFVPGTCQMTLTGHISNHKYNQVLHFHAPGVGIPWLASDLQTITNTAFTQWGVRLKALFAPNVKLDSIASVDLTNSTPASVVSAGAPITATGAGNNEPSLATMVNFTIAARYKGGHPRTYFPPLAATAVGVNSDQWSSTAVTAFNTAVGLWFGDIVVSVPSTVHTVPLFGYTYLDDPVHHNYKRTKTSFLGSYAVGSYSTSGIIRSQRRRMTAAA
jgi:hypothetical protein